MFGYIVPNLSALKDAQKARFRSAYCGLCHVLYKRYGLRGTATLSYDLTFLAILLSALYECEETVGEERCLPHPVKRHSYAFSESFGYVADMNVALAYHKCMDNWLDDRSVPSRAEAALLKRAYLRISHEHPEKCRAIEDWLREIHEIETHRHRGIDAPVNSTGRMLAELFCYRDGDFWSSSLRRIGDGLGRFIYMMDAYDDLPRDLRRHNFNPLIEYQDRADFEQMCKDALVMMVADCTQEFEQLPILQDADLLRNVLYSGIWSKYALIQKKRQAESKGA